MFHVKLISYFADKQLAVGLGACFIVFLLATIGFVALTDEVFEGDTLAFDQAVLQAINASASPALDQFYLIVTRLGGVVSVIAITALAIAFLIKRRRYAKASIVAASVAGVAAINVILKLIFERLRPDLWEQLVVETSYSFPSGHAMVSSALAFTAIAIVWRTKYRALVLVSALLYMVLVGFSRLYLGVHYPTDILAGWLLSAAWLGIVLAVVSGKLYRFLLPNPKSSN